MSNATFASSCTYLIPIVAIGWGLIDGENVSQLQLLSIGLIIFSVYLINKPQKFAE
jgi:drug/metabolite transporter (DMT)-like permease